MNYRRCKCPVWVFGSVEGKRVRKALDTVSWEHGEELLRELDPKEIPVKMTVAEAGDRFLEHCESKHSPDTVAKYNLIVGDMKPLFGSYEVGAIKLDDLTRYVDGWKVAPIMKSKKLERLRAMFRFFMDRGWCKENPALKVTKPKSKFKQRMSYTDEEIEKVLWAIEVYPIKGIYGSDSRARIRAFIRLLLFSGLRIRDAVTLDVSRFQEEAKLLIPTQKTGTPVVLPLPDDVAADVMKLRKPECAFFFWSGMENPKSAVGDWQRTLRGLFKLAGIKGHAHRFRTTFAVRLLNKGVPLEAVAAILGNSFKVCEKHYAPWVKSRQDVLEKAVKATWG